MLGKGQNRLSGGRVLRGLAWGSPLQTWCPVALLQPPSHLLLPWPQPRDSRDCGV